MKQLRLPGSIYLIAWNQDSGRVGIAHLTGRGCAAWNQGLGLVGEKGGGNTMSKPLDESLSREIAQSIKSKATNCFDNAYKAALVTEGSMYVQGFLVYAVEPCLIVEYAWIELEDRIVDPTFPHLDKNAQELSYFPAHRLSVQQMKAAIEEAQEDYPEDDPLPIYGAAPYEYYGDVMLGGADYAAAYSEAEAKCQELSQNHH